MLHQRLKGYHRHLLSIPNWEKVLRHILRSPVTPTGSVVVQYLRWVRPIGHWEWCAALKAPSANLAPMPLSALSLAAPIKIFSPKNLPFNVQSLNRLKIWKYKMRPSNPATLANTIIQPLVLGIRELKKKTKQRFFDSFYIVRPIYMFMLRSMQPLPWIILVADYI